MTDIQSLISRIDAVALNTGASRSTLSRKLFGSGKRIEYLESGGTLTLTTYQRALEMLDELELPTPERPA